ncbi:hypothetical protein SARC_08071 [Sphaeroforma arctica JP610]|uniref:Uncharacterized protein n=1 Tax=Sphaeroforma arctica JP610 TaxID=667725 RepID=A0A0L0FSG8_9EUKA|nr:hypothetical protein SARC_08071 [Sphaeroforma arctica JP610]KNC79536.1 hypothetical protein SARC_08071 [Sphaeroforma arctica JP610]|eukprot:XP_014153438.1 hypothetical protein SARC_08071 [Sphaeroforma arctica JP610]
MPSSLLDAVIKGDIASMKTFIDDGEDVNLADHFNRTYVHWASQGGNKEVVDILIKAGAVFDIRTNSGVSPLHNSLYCGNHSVTKLLLESGASLDKPELPFDQMALHWAARSGNIEVAQILCEKAGADPSRLDKAGHSCGDVARRHGHRRLAIVLDRLRGVDVKSDAEDEDEKSTSSNIKQETTGEHPSVQSSSQTHTSTSTLTANEHTEAPERKERPSQKKRSTKRRGDDSDDMPNSKAKKKPKAVRKPKAAGNKGRHSPEKPGGGRSTGPNNGLNRKRSRVRPRDGHSASRKSSTMSGEEIREKKKKPPAVSFNYDSLFGGDGGNSEASMTMKIPKRKI